jgi:hypothetical protein
MRKYNSGSAWATTHTTQLAATSAIVAYGRSAAHRPGDTPALTRRRALEGARFGRPSTERVRPRSPERAGAFAGGSFGARLRSRLPQYGHSVMYGLTSEPHCLHTTNRSAPEEDIVSSF